MLKLLRFLLLLTAVPVLFALSDRDLSRKVTEVQQRFNLTSWKITVRFVNFEEMFEQNKCRCFGESLVFKNTKTAVVNILDDSGYKEFGITDIKAIHANELFAAAHEVLHIFVETEHPEFDDDMEEAAVRQLVRMVYRQPVLVQTELP